jgi:hypothetical protein
MAPELQNHYGIRLAIVAGTAGAAALFGSHEAGAATQSVTVNGSFTKACPSGQETGTITADGLGAGQPVNSFVKVGANVLAQDNVDQANASGHYSSTSLEFTPPAGTTTFTVEVDRPNGGFLGSKVESIAPCPSPSTSETSPTTTPTKTESTSSSPSTTASHSTSHSNSSSASQSSVPRTTHATTPNRTTGVVHSTSGETTIATATGSTVIVGAETGVSKAKSYDLPIFGGFAGASIIAGAAFYRRRRGAHMSGK